jgi:hypothetical protein
MSASQHHRRQVQQRRTSVIPKQPMTPLRPSTPFSIQLEGSSREQDVSIAEGREGEPDGAH